MQNLDVKRKTKEAASLNKKAVELSASIDGVKSEVGAVNGCLASLAEKCKDQVQRYAESKARREAEINGFEAALDILESETASAQTSRRRFSIWMSGRSGLDRLHYCLE